MSRDWMDSYVSKISDESYDIEQVRKIVDKIMRDLAQKLAENNLPTPKYFKKENKCVLQDCILTFRASGRVLVFSKKSLDKEETLASVDVQDRYLDYRMSFKGQKEIGVVGSVEEAIENAMSFLLITGKF